MLRRLVDFSLENRPLVLIAAALVIAGGRLRPAPAADRRRARHHERPGPGHDEGPGARPGGDRAVRDLPGRGGDERPAAARRDPLDLELRPLGGDRRLSRTASTSTSRASSSRERLPQAREADPAGARQPGDGTGHDRPRRGLPVHGRGRRASRAMERRTILDWDDRPGLRAVPGVTEVNAWGGLPKQYQVVVDPAKLVGPPDLARGGLRRRRAGHAQRRRRLHRAQPRSSTSSAARGSSSRSPTSRRSSSTAGEDGTPVTVGDVAQVREGAMLRIGAATQDGKGETVIGIVQMLAGENALPVATRVRAGGRGAAALAAEGRPDRPLLRPRAASSPRRSAPCETNLFEGGSSSSPSSSPSSATSARGLIVASAIPLSMLFAFTGMVRVAHLGEPDEPRRDRLRPHRRRRGRHGRERRPAAGEPEGRDKTVRQLTGGGRATRSCGRSPSAIGIIILVYLPILTLGGIEGKMFRPMAWTVVFALAGSLLLTLTLMPVLASLFLRKTGARARAALRRAGCARSTCAALDGLLRRTARSCSACGRRARRPERLPRARGSAAEFIPRLDEGDIVDAAPFGLPRSRSPRSAAGTGRSKRVLKRFPEVDHGRVAGREARRSPPTSMGIELGDVFVILKPRADGRRPGRRAS